MILSILNDLLRWSTLTGLSSLHLPPRFYDENQTQPKTLSKQIENVALALLFGRLWSGFHVLVHPKRPFTMVYLPKVAPRLHSVPVRLILGIFGFIKVYVCIFGNIWAESLERHSDLTNLLAFHKSKLKACSKTS